MRIETDRRCVHSDQMKDYEMVENVGISMSEFNDGTFDVEILRYSEIIESVNNIPNKKSAIAVYIQKQSQWLGKVLDNGQ